MQNSNHVQYRIFYEISLMCAILQHVFKMSAISIHSCFDLTMSRTRPLVNDIVNITLLNAVSNV